MNLLGVAEASRAAVRGKSQTTYPFLVDSFTCPSL
jgi:hypothetical protein